MNPTTDRLLAWSQIAISALVLGFTGAIMIIYELGWAHFTPAQEQTFLEDRKWLMGASMLILYFWFQRLRGGGIPDGNTVTQTHTSPDGTTVRTTVPVSQVDKLTIPTPTQSQPEKIQ